MKFTLPKLPYSYEALEPHLDAKTMEIHHTKHHQTYVNNLNAALENAPEFQAMPLEQILTSLPKVPENIRTAVRNHGGGHWNHTLYWSILGPNAGGEPKNEIGNAIKENFGSFQTFKEKFSELATKHFGSGWAWLCTDSNKQLVMKSLSDQICPLSEGLSPIMTIDVWEHAYYLKYQNRRVEFVQAIWNAFNWTEVNERFKNPKRPLPLAG